MLERFRRFAAVALFVVSLAPLSPPAAFGCVCWPPPPDEAFRSAEIVFVGRVAETKDVVGEIVQGGAPVEVITGGIVRFDVARQFKGPELDAVEIRTGGSSCDFSFAEGRSYVVYAQRNAEYGGYAASSCSGTAAIENAQAHLSLLPRLARGETHTMLYGYVLGNAGDSRAELFESSPRAGVAVTAERGGRKYETVTDAGGYYEFLDLPAGSYTVRPTLAEKARGAEPMLATVPAGGVASASWSTSDLGTLRGRVLGPDGRPERELMVHLVLTSEPYGRRTALYATTDEEGKYVFDDVPSGTYHAVVNPEGFANLWTRYPTTYFPGAASRDGAKSFSVEKGREVALPDFFLARRHPSKPVRGVVVTADGNPVAEASVRLRHADGSSATVTTGADGRFEVEGAPGKSYEVFAQFYGASAVLSSAAVEVVVSDALEPLTLVVKPERQ